MNTKTSSTGLRRKMTSRIHLRATLRYTTFISTEIRRIRMLQRGTFLDTPTAMPLLVQRNKTSMNQMAHIKELLADIEMKRGWNPCSCKCNSKEGGDTGGQDQHRPLVYCSSKATSHFPTPTLHTGTRKQNKSHQFQKIIINVDNRRHRVTPSTPCT